MKGFTNMSKSYFAIISIVVFAGYSLYAQQVCPVRIVSVKFLRGHVLDAGRNPVPIKATKLELRPVGNEKSLTTVVTDENGFFEFNKHSKGNYRLSVYFFVNGLEVAPKYDIVVKVKPSRRTSGDKDLVIKLGPSCFESSVTTSLGK